MNEVAVITMSAIRIYVEKVRTVFLGQTFWKEESFSCGVDDGAIACLLMFVLSIFVLSLSFSSVVVVVVPSVVVIVISSVGGGFCCGQVRAKTSNDEGGLAKSTWSEEVAQQTSRLLMSVEVIIVATRIS